MAVTTAPERDTGMQRGESIFKNVVRITALSMIVLLVGVIILLAIDAWPAIQHFGFAFLYTSEWDPVFDNYGAAPFIFGTVVTSILALILATPFAVGGALFISEYAPKTVGSVLSFIIELLVAIPSVGFGLWGLFVLAPFMRNSIDPFLRNVIGPIPVIGELFKGPTIGQDLLTASVILAIMILPTILAIAREIIAQVPRLQKEGMLALGATKWEMLRSSVLPYAWGGIVGGAMLGLARAIGETMAVTMTIGNSSQQISASLFTPGYTIASAIANQFTEADTPMYFSAIVELGLVLLLVSALFNILARVMVRRMTRLPGGAAAQ
ncbi:MAG TPA: phosphate ABC transporter permease subunit PstC [Phototrophicaceae bacterium]|nr:phosphate ABC transporter permease subunit PstC [Phototrophicaceae bacterium]